MHCPHCEAAHKALLDQIVEHKVDLEEYRERVAQLELDVAQLQDVVESLLLEDEVFESDDDEDFEDC